jgi:hypothetical protein
MKKLFLLLAILLFNASFIRAVAQTEDFAAVVAAGNLQSCSRACGKPDDRSVHVGFRCVVEGDSTP